MVIITPATIRLPKQRSKMTLINILIRPPINTGNALRELTTIVSLSHCVYEGSLVSLVSPYMIQRPINGTLVLSLIPQLHFSLSHFSQTEVVILGFQEEVKTLVTAFDHHIQEQSLILLRYFAASYVILSAL